MTSITGTPKIGYFQLTGVESKLLEIAGSNKQIESSEINAFTPTNDAETFFKNFVLNTSNSVIGMDLTPRSIADIEKRMEIANNPLFPVEPDITTTPVTATFSIANKLSPNGNPVVVIDNMFSDTRNPRVIVKSNADTDVLFKDNNLTVLPRSQSGYYGVVLNDNQQLVELDFIGEGLTYPSPIIKQEIGLSVNDELKNGMMNLCIKVPNTEKIMIKTSPDLKTWSWDQNPMTYDNASSSYTKSFATDKASEFYRAFTVEDVYPKIESASLVRPR